MSNQASRNLSGSTMPGGDKAANGTHRSESLSKGPPPAPNVPGIASNGLHTTSKDAVKPPPGGAGRTTIDGPLLESSLTTEYEDILDDLEENSGMAVSLTNIMHARIEELLKGRAQSEKSVDDLTKRLADMTKSRDEKNAQLLKLQKSDAEMKSKLEERDKQLHKHKAAYERVKIVNDRLSKTLAARNSYFERPMKAGKWNNSSLV
ncbi:uncharacterized protein N7496_001707 [Penicillium cataractarum]|uniref:Uncharacterized protein n=1 Tax=Penicillium cataractarum TaxID=2100454 RepID=A0A9W9VWV5_9EURO|nr:uncharacterized protein N7496_001707 [Penicillium cataractarum]KAJ5390639.1 hypothetical protein N7496_001707 [Penicillium cataractarum]